MKSKNYGASHESFKVSAKRFDISPFISKYSTSNTLYGISANRLYPLSTQNDPTEAYWNLRNNVMLYDVPEKPLEISGPDTIQLLETIFTRTITDLKIYRARYAIACTFDGGIFMDGILIRLEENKFWYIHANGDFETWLLAHSRNLNVTIRDPHSWAIQIQGPNALRLLKLAAPEINLEEFKYFHALKLNLNDQEFLVSRTGWTGELGFEIYTNGPNDDHSSLWDHLMETGKNLGIMTGGLDSMGIRRIEAGILDYGTDMNRKNNPFEMGLGPFVDLTKENFIGKDKLLQMNKSNCFYGVACENTIPFGGLEILDNEQVVGHTTVGAFSPFLDKGIGYTLFTKQGNWPGKKLNLRSMDKTLYECEITSLPFYDFRKKIPRGQVKHMVAAYPVK